MIRAFKLPRPVTSMDWSQLSFGHRIVVLGCPGAGKSVLSSELGRVLDIPIFRMDDLYWLGGWRRPQQQDFCARVDEVISKERWILDGNYDSILDRRLCRADTVVFVDTPTILCLYRIASRGLKRRLGDTASLPERVRGMSRSGTRVDARFVLKVLRFRSQVLPSVRARLEDFTHDGKVYWLSV